MELLRSVQMKYHDASYSEKTKILDWFVEDPPFYWTLS